MILKISPPLKRIQLLKKQTGYPESSVHKRRFPFGYIWEKGNVHIEIRYRHTRESRQLQKDFSGKAL